MLGGGGVSVTQSQMHPCVSKEKCEAQAQEVEPEGLHMPRGACQVQGPGPVFGGGWGTREERASKSRSLGLVLGVMGVRPLVCGSDLYTPLLDLNLGFK